MKKTHVITCSHCFKTFSTKFNLKRHEKVCDTKNRVEDEDTISKEIFCEVCEKTCAKKTFTSHLRSNEHIKKSLLKVDDNCFVYQSALQGNLIIYRVLAQNDEENDNMNIKSFLSSVSECVLKVLKNQLQEKQTLKFRLNLNGLYNKPGDSDEMIEEAEKSFYSKYRTLVKGDDIEENYREASEELVEEADSFSEVGSGWTILQFTHISIEIAKVNFVGTG